MSSAAMTEDPASTIPETYLCHPESKRPKKRKAEQALENDRRLLPRLQAALSALDGKGGTHYTLRKSYQNAPARIGNPPVYHLKAVATRLSTI
ncbi:hypothetical protein FAVG1_08424 [Fusarium avenaceum]|nr:hypothetical protein FAVG1_08424 [Fusarium avenaceum]